MPYNQKNLSNDMKVAILTQPLGKNYGGILQAYALQQILRSLGHEVIILNRVDNYPSLKLLIWRLASLVKSFYSKWFRRKKYIQIVSPFAREYITDSRLIYDYSELIKFIDENINITCEIRSSNKLRKYLLKNECKVIVVGSDQVWREEYSPHITDYFGGFAKGNDGFKFLSYAASLGQNKLPISAAKSHLCGVLLKKFSAISVREQSAVNLLKHTWGIESKLVLDPTLLLEKEYYEKLISSTVDNQNNNIFCYILDETNEKKQVIQKIASAIGKEVNQILLYPHHENGSSGKLTSIPLWLSGISNAEFVVTDSYHGCILSIIFNKKFIVIANRKRGVDRFSSILELFHLENRIIYSLDDLTESMIKDNIDYLEINNIVRKFKHDSLCFLQSALEK